MNRSFQYSLVLLFFVFLHLTVDAEFAYHPKKANLTIHFENNEWTLTNTSSTITYLKFSGENAYVQIINDEMHVYTMSEGLWNARPSAKFLDRLNVKHKTVKIETHPTRFDAYSSFWISSSGGHIRIFRFYEKIDGVDLNGKPTVHYNYHNGNHLFLNQNELSHIRSTNTIFMISPQRNIFEIDPQRKIWRFILLNRTLTPWTSEPPTDKMMFYIFKREDFKKVIPIGSKNDKYYVQIIDHKNRMGIATLTHAHFQIEYLIPPQFDFISPALKNDYFLVYNKQKMGVAYFEPPIRKDDIPLIKAVYTSAKTKLYASGDENTPAPLLADGKKFKISENDTVISSNVLATKMNYGIELITPDLILYNEYTPSGTISHSGLYRVSQNRWYLAPEQKQLLRYPNAILSVDTDKKTKLNSYNTFNLNGDIRQTNVTDVASREFFKVASLLTEVEIDTMTYLPKYDPFTYSFRVQNKWGVMHIEKDQFKIVLPPQYDWIDSFGVAKSLILAQSNTFGWYGESLCPTAKLTLIPPQKTSFSLVQGNVTPTAPPCNSGPKCAVSIQYLNEYFVYNATVKTKNGTSSDAWISSDLHQENKLKASKISFVNDFILTEKITPTGDVLSLYTSRLKPIELDAFDSVFVSGSSVVLLKSMNASSAGTAKNSEYSSHRVVAAFHEKKRIALQKFSSVRYYHSHFICAKKGDWVILDLEGKNISKQTFPRMEDAVLALSN